jgi:hypothetical protein
MRDIHPATWLVAQVLELPGQPFADLPRTPLDLTPVTGLDLHAFGKAPFKATQRCGISVARGHPHKLFEKCQRVVQAHLGEVGGGRLVASLRSTSMIKLRCAG